MATRRTPPPRPGTRPSPRPVEHQAARPVEHQAVERRRDGGPGARPGVATRTRPDQQDRRTRPEQPGRARTASGGGQQDFSGGLTGTEFQQEIEALRGEVGSLKFGKTWQQGSPPKVAGPFGPALQSVEVGNNLRLAGRAIADRLAQAADTSAKALALVKAHKPPTYGAKP